MSFFTSYINCPRTVWYEIEKLLPNDKRGNEISDTVRADINKLLKNLPKNKNLPLWLRKLPDAQRVPAISWEGYIIIKGEK